MSPEARFADALAPNSRSAVATKLLVECAIFTHCDALFDSITSTNKLHLRVPRVPKSQPTDDTLPE